MTDTTPSDSLRRQAERLRRHLSLVHGVKLKQAAGLEALAALHGAANWNTLRAANASAASTTASTQTTCATVPSALASAEAAQTRHCELVSRIEQSISCSGPLVLGKAEDERMHRKQLLRMLQAFPRMFDFWTRHAMPPKAAPQCFCCHRCIFEAPVAVRHPELPGVHVCALCAPAPAAPDTHPDFQNQ